MQEDQVFLFSTIRMWLVISLMKHGQYLVNNKLWWQDSCSLFWFEFILLYKFPYSKNSKEKTNCGLFYCFTIFITYLNLSQPCTVRSLGRRVLCNFQTRQFRKLSGSGNETNFRFDHCNKWSKDSSINVKHSKWDKIFCPNLGNNIRHGK